MLSSIAARNAAPISAGRLPRADYRQFGNQSRIFHFTYKQAAKTAAFYLRLNAVKRISSTRSYCTYRRIEKCRVLYGEVIISRRLTNKRGGMGIRGNAA